MDKQCSWFTEGQTDRQTNRMCIAECAQRDYLTVCCRVCVCVRVREREREQDECVYMSICISVFADLCLLRYTVLFVCAHSCVPICAVQISHCWGKAL